MNNHHHKSNFTNVTEQNNKMN